MTAQDASTEILNDILNWIREFVEKPNPLLNNWPPCPYAKEARLAQKISMEVCHAENVQERLHAAALALPDSAAEVHIIALTPEQMLSIDETKCIVKEFRNQWASQDIYLLKDHPHDVEETNGLCMNNGRYQLFFLQRLSSLQKASQDLKAKGYYAHWDQDYYSRVVTQRESYANEKSS